MFSELHNTPSPLVYLLVCVFQVKTDDRVVKMDLGLLFLRVRKSDAGTYFCQTVEHSFVHTVRKITLEVVEEQKVEGMFHKDHEEERHHKMPCPPLSSLPQGTKPWYKEFLQLIGYSNFQRVEEYCEKVWCTDKKRKKLKMSPSKWKYANPQEKRLRSKPEHFRLPRHALDSWGRPLPAAEGRAWGPSKGRGNRDRQQDRRTPFPCCRERREAG